MKEVSIHGDLFYFLELIKWLLLCFASMSPLSAGKGTDSQKVLDGKVEYLHPAEDGEAGEESHGAADKTELGVDRHLHVSLYLVIGCRIKINLNHLQGSGGNGGVWKI